MFLKGKKFVKTLNSKNGAFSNVTMCRNQINFSIKEYQEVVNKTIDSISDQTEEILENSVNFTILINRILKTMTLYYLMEFYKFKLEKLVPMSFQDKHHQE
jgi:hypothetical protein